METMETMETMKKQMRRLPTEVIQYIIGYTVAPQSPNLRKDIHSFVESKRRIMYLYDQYWTVDMGELEDEYKYWIANDIISYANNYQGTVFGLVDNFYTIFYRNLRLKNTFDIGVFWNHLQKKSVDTQINLLWGLLLPDERDALISVFPDGPILLEEEEW
jgi:hypothetical protein